MKNEEISLATKRAIAGMFVRYIDGAEVIEQQMTIDTIPDLLRITIMGFIQERGMAQERNVTKL